ncbi:MAG: radical SAM protein [Candidatus Hodarchaeota archaeon]
MKLKRSNFQRLLSEPHFYYALFKKRVLTRYNTKFLDGQSPLLELCYFILTWRCNLRCKMCFEYGASGIFSETSSTDLRRNEMEIEDWKRIVDDLQKFRPIIHLFGGEPLLYEDLDELVWYIKQAELRCQIVTNGTLLAQKARELVNNGVDEVWVSVDGPRDIHDQIRGVDGTYDKILNGIEILTKLKKEEKASKPIINFIYTITDENYTRLGQFMESIDEYAVPLVVFSHVLFLTEDLLRRHVGQFDTMFQTTSKEWEGYVIDPAKNIHIDGLIESIREVKEKYGKRISFSPDLAENELRAYYKDFRYTVNRMCYAPWLTAVISPEGNVSPCSDFVIGNTKNKSFDEIWNGEKVRTFRRALVKRRKFPVCDRCCMIHRHAIFH